MRIQPRSLAAALSSDMRNLAATAAMEGQELTIAEARAAIAAARQGDGLAVVGLAECGLKGWYQEGVLDVLTARPGDLHDPEAFAVMAVGGSMRPAGIFPGFLCLCSPQERIDPGDAIYIQRRDGTASIKLYRGGDADWIELAGYRPPDEAGAQAAYTERLLRNQVVTIAPVVYVKRKL